MFENIKEQLNNLNFFSNRKNGFLGIDIGGSAIKVVQLKRERGVAVLETYGEISLGPIAGTEVGRATSLSDKELSSALMSLMKESRVSASQCGVAIPVNFSLIFEMAIPYAPEAQLKKIIPIEARRYIPVPISEVVLDWRIIPENKFTQEDEEKEDLEDNRPAFNNFNQEKRKPVKKIKVFVVAIHKNALDKYRGIVRQAQLALNFLEIEVFSTIRSVADHSVLDTVAMLDFGASISKLYIVEYGITKETHIISRGSQDISLAISRTLGISIQEAEEEKRKIDLSNLKAGGKESPTSIMALNLKYIFSEVSNVLNKYQRENNQNIKELIFTGGGVVIKGLDKFTSENLEINSRIADPFAKIKKPAFLDEVLSEIGPEFAVAVGVALRGLEEQK